MLVMEDRRKEVKAILCEELDNLRQRIIESWYSLWSSSVRSSGGGTCLGESTERIL